MSSKGAIPVFGGGALGLGKNFEDADIYKLYDLLLSGGCNKIDTAKVYGNSEERIGQTKGGDRLAIDTKTPGGIVPGEGTSEGILKNAEESAKKAGVKQFDIFYIHAPDPSVPLADQLAGINAAYKKGLFKRFGVSNFSAAQVQETYDHCKANNYPLPAVYQGNYSAVARLQETEILPTLRKLGIAFYAYSPMAGGFLTKSAAQIRSAEDVGRFSKEAGMLYEMYAGMYAKDSILAALDTWDEAAKVAGASKGELAYRWVAFDSGLDGNLGDGVVFGASSVAQVEQTLGWWKKGSVGPQAKALIDEMWEKIKGDATLNNIGFDGVASYKATAKA